MSKTTTILEWARAAKRANEASGEGEGEEVISDELLIRAATSWMLMLDSLEFLESVLPSDSLGRETLRCAVVEAEREGIARTLCIMHIASAFHDVEPSTPQRAALFTRKIDEVTS